MSATGPFPFASLFLAIPTPFAVDGTVQRTALDHAMSYALAQSPTGLALLTEAAEDALLLPEERRAIVRSGGAQTRGQAELIIAVSSPSTRAAVDLVRFAEEQGATAFILSPPGLPGLGYRALYRHTELISRATARPVLLEVRPGNAAFRLAPEEQATLVQHPGLKGVFVPQSSPATLKPWARRFENRSAAILNGCAFTLGEDAEHGATGAVCGLSLLAPTVGRSVSRAVAERAAKAWRALVQASAPAVYLLAPPRPVDQLDGIHKLAARLAQRPLEAEGLSPSYPSGLLKAGLKLLGHPVEARVRPPFEGPSEEQIVRLRSALKPSGFLA